MLTSRYDKKACLTVFCLNHLLLEKLNYNIFEHVFHEMSVVQNSDQQVFVIF
jgi:hypothetical protein